MHAPPESRSGGAVPAPPFNGHRSRAARGLPAQQSAEQREGGVRARVARAGERAPGELRRDAFALGDERTRRLARPRARTRVIGARAARGCPRARGWRPRPRVRGRRARRRPTRPRSRTPSAPVIRAPTATPPAVRPRAVLPTSSTFPLASSTATSAARLLRCRRRTSSTRACAAGAGRRGAAATPSRRRAAARRGPRAQRPAGGDAVRARDADRALPHLAGRPRRRPTGRRRSARRRRARRSSNQSA